LDIVVYPVIWLASWSRRDLNGAATWFQLLACLRGYFLMIA
jgi:hypothetical protein